MGYADDSFSLNCFSVIFIAVYFSIGFGLDAKLSSIIYYLFGLQHVAFAFRRSTAEGTPPRRAESGDLPQILAGQVNMCNGTLFFGFASWRRGRKNDRGSFATLPTERLYFPCSFAPAA